MKTNTIIYDPTYEYSQVLLLDGKKILNKKTLIKIIYDYLGCPEDFGHNWDALYDTLRDNEFRVKKPISVYIINYASIFNGNSVERNIFSDILISLIQGKQGFYKIVLG